MGGVPALIAFRSNPGVTAWHDSTPGACAEARQGRPDSVARSLGRAAILTGAGSHQIELAMQFGVKWRPLGHRDGRPSIRAWVTRLH